MAAVEAVLMPAARKAAAIAQEVSAAARLAPATGRTKIPTEAEGVTSEREECFLRMEIREPGAEDQHGVFALRPDQRQSDARPVLSDRSLP